MAIGMLGWLELAFGTASIARERRHVIFRVILFQLMKSASHKDIFANAHRIATPRQGIPQQCSV